MDEGGQQGAGQGAEDRDPGVAPVAVSFRGNWEKGVHRAGGEIAGGIDGGMSRRMLNLG